MYRFPSLLRACSLCIAPVSFAADDAAAAEQQITAPLQRVRRRPGTSTMPKAFRRFFTPTTPRLVDRQRGDTFTGQEAASSRRSATDFQGDLKETTLTESIEKVSPHQARRRDSRLRRSTIKRGNGRRPSSSTSFSVLVKRGRASGLRKTTRTVKYSQEVTRNWRAPKVRVKKQRKI